MKTIKGFHIQHSLCWGQAVLLCLLRLLWQDTETSKGQSFLLNYFWVRWNRGLNRIIKVRPIIGMHVLALPSAVRWKAVRFHAPLSSPSEPLTWREKIWHQSWQKHKGEKWTIPLWLPEHQSCSIFWGKNNAVLFVFQRWQTALVTGLTLSIPITQNPKQITVKLWPCC